MQDEQRLSIIKKELDALKVSQGVFTEQYNAIKKDVKDRFGVKTLKEAETLLKELQKKQAINNTRKNLKFEEVENKLKEYRRR